MPSPDSTRGHEPPEGFPWLNPKELVAFDIAQLAAESASPVQLKEIREQLGFEVIRLLAQALEEKKGLKTDVYLYPLPAPCMRTLDSSAVESFGDDHVVTALERVLYTDGTQEPGLEHRETDKKKNKKITRTRQDVTITNATLIIKEQRGSIRKKNEQYEGPQMKLLIFSLHPERIAQYIHAMQGLEQQEE